jgi:sugar lactone lactonase YvrE
MTLNLTTEIGLMSSKQPVSSEVLVLMNGIAMGESPRWHQGRLWFADWGAQQIISVDAAGHSEVMMDTHLDLPFSIDWLPDGRLLLVAGRESLILRKESDGTIVTHADLRSISDMGWNEIVVDQHGRAYVNGGPGIVAMVNADGSARQVADNIAFPNGMAITSDNKTLIIAESHGKRLTAFDIDSDGGLSHRRGWADLIDGFPDGICIDTDNAVWYADVPNKRCVRVREGGEVLQTVSVDRGCFACMLGGTDGKTLFIVATEWRGMAQMAAVAAERTGMILTAQAPAAAAGCP